MQQGDVIKGRFEVGERLGNGAMGVVHVGVDKTTGERVAIKAVRPEIAKNSDDIAKRFIREGRALGKLNHPHIVTVVDIVDEGDELYIIMEYVDGVTLSYQISKYKRLPIKPTVQVSYALASAVAHIHERGIIHRDIKPSNIMFTGKGSPRLMDFGVAHLDSATPMTVPGTVLGTLAYVAPEIVMGNKADYRADVWSLGMTMYKMLIGELPFGGKTPAVAIAEILTKPLPDLILLRPDTPPRLAGLVTMMLQKEPSQRIDSMARVKNQLKGIMDGM